MYPDPKPEWPKPEQLTVVTFLGELLHYTDVSQFDYIRAIINQRNNNDCNVRLEPDGTTIRWYWGYYLPMGWYLLDGKESAPGDVVARMVRPTREWSDEQLHQLMPDTYPDPNAPTAPPAGE